MTEPASNAIDWPLMLETHRSWLTRVLRCRMGDEHAVEDALQEIALAVIRQVSPGVNGGQLEHPNFSPSKSDNHPRDQADQRSEPNGRRSRQAATGIPEDPEKFAPWLYRIAVRQAVNFHRKANRRSTAKPLPDLEVISTEQQPLDWLLKEEEQAKFQTTWNQLSAAQREILTLKYGERWSYQQLSDHLGIPVRSVEYRLLQARTELRNRLSQPFEPIV